MDAARVANLGAAIKRFGDAEGFNVADHCAGVDEVEADGRVGELLALFHVDDVGGGRQKAAGLALERQVLSVELAGGKRDDREEAEDSKVAEGAKIHVVSTPGERGRLPPLAFTIQLLLTQTKRARL